MTIKTKKILLIDANSLIHRAFHALPPLTSRDGKPAQAIYGLASILLKIWKEEKPEYVAALFDRPEPTFRKQRYAEYKAHRPPAPEGLISQIIEAHNLFSSFGIKTFEEPGFEADDLIATLAEQFRHENNTAVTILTGDMDTLQLVGEAVSVKILRKGVSETQLYDEDAVKHRFGLEPKQLVDYKALVGDPSDNIKGVPGIGPKTATELLQRFSTLENLYAHLDEDPRASRKLEGYRKEAELSKSLVVLDTGAPLHVAGFEVLKTGEIGEAALEYFKRQGFETLYVRARERLESDGVSVIQGSMFPSVPGVSRKNRRKNSS